MLKRILLVASLAATPAMANTKDIITAGQLGTVLASEQSCGLIYDQDAIANWIAQNTDPSYMGFARQLNASTSNAQRDLEDMSESSKTAHCTSVSQTAKHYGFIE